MSIAEFYYLLKPAIPRFLQFHLRRQLIKHKQSRYADIWPIDGSASKPRESFTGWPDDKQFAVILTHDVDTEMGHARCLNLAHLEQEVGFHSSFNFVPERYKVDPTLRTQLVENGFEVGVHGLNHDGKLYSSKKVFQERAIKINGYLKAWGAVGFRSPAMHHNLEWLHDLDIEYDASTFDTDPFEPQPDGVGTIFPFWVEGRNGKKGYVELPYTLPQDFTLFILMKEKNINIWRRKLDWIAEHGGMALINTHPDYMHFGRGRLGLEEYPVRYYVEFLEYVKGKYEGQYWHVLPRKIAKWWREMMKSD